MNLGVKLAGGFREDCFEDPARLGWMASSLNVMLPFANSVEPVAQKKLAEPIGCGQVKLCPLRHLLGAGRPVAARPGVALTWGR